MSQEVTTENRVEARVSCQSGVRMAGSFQYRACERIKGREAMGVPMTQDRKISVMGKAKVACEADTTVVRIRVSGISTTYEKAAAEMARCTGALKDSIEESGLDRKLLKTESLSVSQNIMKVPTGEGRYGMDYKEIPDGFRFDGGFSVSFPNDGAVLSRMVRGMAVLKPEPRLEFSFLSSRREEMVREALSRATRNAMEDARTIAEATGSRLGPLSRADYSPRESQVRALTVACNDGIPCDDMDIDPKDDVVEVTASFEWDIA